MNSTAPSELSPDQRHSQVAATLERSEQLRRKGHYDQAISLLLDALQHGVDKTQIYYRLGNIYYDAGKLEHAEYVYRKVITLDPLHINAHHNLGVVYRRQKRIAESIKMRRRANKLARQHPERIKLNPQQVRYARRYARRMLFWGLMLTAAFVLAVFLWLSR